MHHSLLTASSSLSPAMNESKPKTTLLSFFFFFFFVFFFTSGFAKPLQYQTLSLGSLPNPSKLNLEDDDLSWSESSQTLTSPESESSSETNPSSLTLRLEHRDALSSNETPQSLFNLRLQRDETRVKTLIAASNAQFSKKNVSHSALGSKDGFSSSIISGLSQGSGEYFTRLGVGTPPKYNFMVLDTGSDVVWLQCAPCRKCYSQSDPIFDPKRSGTFVSLSCSSSLCKKLDVSGCNQRKACLYQVNYGDGSFTVGEFSTETLTFRGTKVPNVALGCGHDNEGLFVGAAGLLGLGRGTLSFPSQAGRSFGGKFSYCLVDRTSSVPSKQSSSMVFGESSVPGTALFTPMLSNPKLDTFYYLTLLGISVGGTRVRGIRDSMFKIDPNGSGGVIIDSGTSVTRLARPAYIAFRDAFRSGATGLKIAPGYSLFDTCFDLTGKSEVKVPTVVMHFGGGADLALPASNYLIPVNTNGTFCFAFAGTSGGLSIIGNIQQQGFRVVFDNAGSRIGFAPRGCS